MQQDNLFTIQADSNLILALVIFKRVIRYQYKQEKKLYKSITYNDVLLLVVFGGLTMYGSFVSGYKAKTIFSKTDKFAYERLRVLLDDGFLESRRNNKNWNKNAKLYCLSGKGKLIYDKIITRYNDLYNKRLKAINNIKGLQVAYISLL